MLVKAKLVACTQPTQALIEESGGAIKNIEDFIAYAARVSNPDNQFNPENSKLINYLLEHKHNSPFEMAHITLEMETTRDIARQVLRHRSAAFQEFSFRYADPVEEFGIDDMFVLREARLQDNKNRQNSIPTNDPIIKDLWRECQEKVFEVVLEQYEVAKSLGIAKEQRRCLFPEGNTKSRLYMTAPVRTWVHFIQVRTDPSTQKEHRVLALAAAKAISEEFPLITRFVCKS